jgi:hypothetical protein
MNAQGDALRNRKYSEFPLPHGYGVRRDPQDARLISKVPDDRVAREAPQGGQLVYAVVFLCVNWFHIPKVRGFGLILDALFCGIATFSNLLRETISR